jgi:hypothetical protein
LDLGNTKLNLSTLKLVTGKVKLPEVSLHTIQGTLNCEAGKLTSVRGTIKTETGNIKFNSTLLKSGTGTNFLITGNSSINNSKLSLYFWKYGIRACNPGLNTGKL